MDGERPRGPGLAKARPALLEARSLRLVRLLDGAVARAFERADVVSEGGTSAEAEGPVYFGSTSLLLPREALPEGPTTSALAAALAWDLHARVRATRIAAREALLRCGGAPRTTELELAVRATERGVVFDVDVVVRLRGRRAARSSR